MYEPRLFENLILNPVRNSLDFSCLMMYWILHNTQHIVVLMAEIHYSEKT